MSDREKKLLILFAVAGFLVINFLLIGFLRGKREKLESDLSKAERQLDTARLISESRDQVAEEMEWLAKFEPEPAAEQDVQTKLQKLCETEARSTGLTITSQKPLPSEASEGAHFQRVKFQFTVSGEEQALYRWFNAVNMPDQLRIATKIQLKPDKDDTKIDCTAIIEQCFIPITEDAADAEASNNSEAAPEAGN
jgi:type II secretory pathway component PulM